MFLAKIPYLVYTVESLIFFLINLFIYLFIFGCVGSSFLCEGFLQLQRAGATLHRGARASHCRGLSSCGAQAPDAQAQQLWPTGLAAPRHVGSSQTRARTRVPCTGRQILNHYATREAPRITNIELTTNSNSCLNEVYLNTYILPLRHITAFLCLGTLQSTSALCLGAILNSQIINKKQKNVTLNKPRKGRLLIAGELKQESRVSPCSASVQIAHKGQLKFFTTLHVSANDHKSTASIILGLHINFSE